MVGQLLNIHSVNGQLSYNTTKPFLYIKNEYPKIEISRQKGSFNITSRQIKFTMDSFELRNQTNAKTAASAVAENAQKGIQAAQDYAGSIAEQGDILINDISGDAFAQVAEMKSNREEPEPSGFIPFVFPEITWQPNKISIDFVPDQIKLSFQAAKPSFETKRGKIDISVGRKAYVDIKYIGEPEYPAGHSSLDVKT